MNAAWQWTLTYLIFCFFTLNIGDSTYLQRGCSDFNIIEKRARNLNLKGVYISPRDSVAQLCSEPLNIKGKASIAQSDVSWNDVAIVVLYGYGRKLHALRWWLQLVPEGVEILMMADACILGMSDTCPDLASRVVDELRQTFPHLSFQIIRANPWEKRYDKLFCKVRTCMSKIFGKYPNKKYYFKMDTDTILLPRRFFRFLNTLHSVVDGDRYPYYFGTITESGSGRILCGDQPQWSDVGPTDKGGLCFAQGGAGYGLNNLAMRQLTSNDTGCTRDIGELWPEDVYTALKLYRTAGVMVMHCSGFRSSEVVTTELLTKAISFHYINATWLEVYGGRLLRLYERE